LVWKTVEKSTLKDQRGSYELELIQHLHKIVPDAIDIMVLADRGFGDQRLFAYLDMIGWGFCIRFKQNILVTHNGTSRPAAQRIPRNGHATMLRDVTITGDKTPLKAVVFKHQRRMKQAWCIATNRREACGAWRSAHCEIVRSTLHDRRDLP
jgi:hypothetical protein